ncbi:molybdopterin molybdotransferase MoeA [Halobacillus yeomjeoni]|uniref:molybdopterin molybdotransferase MoeA n=1 Tax=Halobacillus yeomjeoni TaxID=311194 RepID=UPI001CD5F17B|nr:gephyrin-like molybdotransferase Glp [Halobacillus yeomjeoni]MCA0983690.1 molybdopterin molybdotransferase MoeA [Halobacillus yeomjeoni]
MNLHRTPIPVNEAVEKIMEHSRTGETENIGINEADGRVIAEDLVATHPIPPFHKSPYDGFALRSKDTTHLSKDNPGRFVVTETVGAGSRASRFMKEGETVRIMTGAEIPPGADCVAMFEICQTEEKGDQSWMTLKRPMDPNQNIILQGSETTINEKLVSKGSRVNPGVKALLATFGYAKVKVYKKPVVGVFATGTELLEVEDELIPGKIRNSNAYMIVSQIERAGAEARYLGKLVDDLPTCFQAVAAAIQDVDFLITTGGVSVGDFDLMPEIYEKLGAEVLFNKVAMRPGSVTTAASVQGKLLFGLSGNPSACYVGFELFTFPILQRYLGRTHPYHRTVQATLGRDFKKANPFTRFVRGFIEYEEGKVVVYPAGLDKSAVVSSLAYTDALIMLPGGTRGFKQGDRVEAVLLEDLKGRQKL